MVRTLSPSELLAMEVTERVTSALSLVGFLFILITYLCYEEFNKPINRLIFYASWSNLGTTIAGLIGERGVVAGQDSTLCQAQAFIIQMLQGVDVYWALCMSFNVYLALFCGWSTKRMNSLEWRYLLGCYGLSSIPAITYLFVSTEAAGKVYGPAILWCWISPTWVYLRIATLYGIIWVAMIMAFGIYCIALAKAWRNRRALAGLFNPLNENPFGALVTTDVEIVSSAAHELDNEDRHALAGGHKASSSASQMELSYYSAKIQAEDKARGRQNSRPHLLRVGTLTRNAALEESNAEAWLFARVAFLFFVVMMFCWTPASINRLYSTIHPKDLVFGLNYAAALMLPLQGLFNAVVYALSSQSAVRGFLTGRLRVRSPKCGLSADRAPRSNYVEVSDSIQKDFKDQSKSRVSPSAAI